MSQGSLWAFSLACALLTGLVAWEAENKVQSPGITIDAPHLNCTLPPAFTTGYQREPDGIVPAGQGFDFQGVSWLQADLCSTGILKVTAVGQKANGENPVLQIALNSETLASETFGLRRSVNIHVPHSGRLTLGYFNDYYKSDARIATLENLSFSGLSCKSLAVDVPAATGGQWVPQAKTASLVSAVAMTVTPCSAGTLSLRVVGRAGMNIFPMLEFRQQEKPLLSIQTGLNREAIQLDITASPLKINLTNPYFKQLADRNLQLLSVQFVPDIKGKP
jgi:hypothetical protein